MSPFYTLIGEHPRVIALDSRESPEVAESVRERVSRIKRVREVARESLEHAREYQAQYYNRRRQARVFAEGQLVWLSLKNWPSLRPNKKLGQLSTGPLRVVERIGKQAY